jgi:ankyrin repeat protein
MIKPLELSLGLPMEVANKVISTTDKVWEILLASRDGDLEHVKRLVNECPELIYGQYNYTPPIHFAVREGHIELVKYLLDKGAHDPNYKIYPFLDKLELMADDRGYTEIVDRLNDYATHPERQQFLGIMERSFLNAAIYNWNFKKRWTVMIWNIQN